MAKTPPPSQTIDFRAPPPSPVAPGQRLSYANDDVLTEFLYQSLKVPDLILPDKAFPKQKLIQTPPRVDFKNLDSLERDKLEVKRITEVIGQLGFFEVINHGISRDLIGAALESWNGVFEMPAEDKNWVRVRSSERRLGFEEEVSDGGDDDDDDDSKCEEFLWRGDDVARLEMEGLLGNAAYLNLREKMQMLHEKVEELAGKTLQLLLTQQHDHVIKTNDDSTDHDEDDETVAGKLCHVKRLHCCGSEDDIENSLRYDVIRMLIRGSQFPHALSFHMCSGNNIDFHFYSKKGWLSFSPHQDSLVITVGDKLQAWSGGQYKHVIGRPVFKGEEDQQKFISMAFLYSPQNETKSIKECDGDDQDKTMTISLSQQIIISVSLILIYQFLLYIFKYCL